MHMKELPAEEWTRVASLSELPPEGYGLAVKAEGLGIAIFALVPFNFFSSQVSNLEFELQTAATNLEVMLGAQSASEVTIAGQGSQSSAHGSSL